MKYIALIDSIDMNDWHWPEQAEKEFVELFGEENLRANRDYTTSIWMGNWLMRNKDKFDSYDESYEVENPDPSKAYVHNQRNHFGWVDRTEESEMLYVRVESIPDNVLWIVSTNYSEVEQLTLYDNPQENGFLRRKAML